MDTSLFLRALIFSGVVVTGLYFFDKKRERPSYYFASFLWLILAIFVINFLIPNKLAASLDDGMDKQYYLDKIDFHKKNGDRTYQEAKSKCWYLPDVDERERAKECFVVAASALLPSEPRSKLIGLVLSTMVTYGINCYDEWNFINTKLQWAKYHYEMMEFYQQVVEII